MRKILIQIFIVFGLCGFQSLSGQVHDFDIENKTPNTWLVEQQNSVIKAYNTVYDLELTIYTDTFLPNSPQCLSNKRIKDIKFDIDIYKKAQKGDKGWAKMVERMRIYFTGSGVSEEKRVYGSNLLKNNSQFNQGEVVHIGTLQFLAPLTCEKVDNMRMRVTGIVVQGRTLPPLELLFKLNK